KMEERIIVSVCGHPEIYDTTSYSYRDRTKKEIAWKKISEEVGLPDETIRGKWKGLRDTYVREKKKETEKKSGSGASQGKKWKYFAVLSFLDPFVTPRETSSNMGRGVEENGTVEYTTEVTLPGRSEDTAAGPLLLECLQRTSPPPPTEDELFFQSLLPSLQRLPPQQKEFIKFQIHKLIHESSTVTLNLENAFKAKSLRLINQIKY
uniref:MADF domain-containing protein n=1 Tax=Sinocyclocheilus anshuiensis TaxID=1608454 RepID=A0A671PYE7_9TELE